MSDVSITDLTAAARNAAKIADYYQTGEADLFIMLADALEAAERDAQQAEDQANNLAGDVVQLEVKLQNAQTTLEMDEKYINKLEGKIARLQAVTVPTEDLAQQTHPFSQSPHMAAKYWAELVRARNRIAELEAAAVPVEPEWGTEVWDCGELVDRDVHPDEETARACARDYSGHVLIRREISEWQKVEDSEPTQ
jgi:predicted exporter